MLVSAFSSCIAEKQAFKAVRERERVQVEKRRRES
jgi:hypothetical protein